MTLDFIESHNNDALTLYHKILKLHETLQDWYADKKIYHYLGYLFCNFKKATSFKTVWELWESTGNRIDFKKKIKDIIKIRLFPEGVIEIDSDVDWYNDEKPQLIRLLLLLDVIHSINNNQSFLPSNAFFKTSNDIEHIFPQNPEKVNDKKSYIEYINKYVIENEREKFDISDFDKKLEDEIYLASVEGFIIKHISSIDINSIGNLVLLYNILNKSLGRISYTKKRAKVIAYYNKGNFIQPHSFKVFVRQFNNIENNNKDLEHWTNLDITANAENINTTIINFFKEEHEQ